MLSAQLDGEDNPADRARAGEHVAGCAGCREWLDRAATVNRLTRTGLVTDVPDLTGAILAALHAEEAGAELKAEAGEGAQPGRRVGGTFKRRGGTFKRRAVVLGSEPPANRQARAAIILFVALAAVGAVQLILGLAQIGGGTSSLHVHTGEDATPGHLWHESAAWNVAVGAGYLFIALRRNRPTGLVPMLTAFVGMLLLLSVNDLSAARVDAERLVSHGFVIVGYLIVVALSRVGGGFAQPPGSRVPVGTGWHLVEDDDEVEAPRPPRLRLVQPGPLTARYDDHQEAA